jgi:hypothetical protein
MANVDQHLRQADKNRKFAQTLLDEKGAELADWALTAVFYSAVHYGRAFVAASGGPVITSHHTFDSEFARVVKHPTMYSHYRRLKDESEKARYDCVAFDVEGVRGLIRKNLTPFWEYLRKTPELKPHASAGQPLP